MVIMKDKDPLPAVVGCSFGMMAAVFVSLVESTAAYKAAAWLASATPPPAHVLSRGIRWQVIGILLDGHFGTGTGSAVSVENAGLLGSTRVGSRRVIQISAGFMIFFSILGKFGALFASIPFLIFAVVYCVLFGIVAAVGLSFLQFTNLNSMRNLFITGFNDYINTIFTSPLTVALIIAVFLDNTLEFKDMTETEGCHGGSGSGHSRETVRMRSSKLNGAIGARLSAYASSLRI